MKRIIIVNTAYVLGTYMYVEFFEEVGFIIIGIGAQQWPSRSVNQLKGGVGLSQMSLSC